jgi:regulator of replication initiation timing
MARSSAFAARTSGTRKESDEVSVRLEEVLAENAFLGEALQKSRARLRQMFEEKNEEIAAMKKRQHELENQLWVHRNR